MWWRYGAMWWRYTVWSQVIVMKVLMVKTSAGSLNTVKFVLCFHYEKFPLHHIQSPNYIPFEITGDKQNNPLFHCRLG